VNGGFCMVNVDEVFSKGLFRNQEYALFVLLLLADNQTIKQFNNSTFDNPIIK
jgi:hypothetical protein